MAASGSCRVKAGQFATAQQGSERVVTERVSSRRRGHDPHHTPQQATPVWGNRPKGDNNGPPVEANYDPMLSMGPCRVSQERVRCGSRSVKAMLQGCDIERRGGEVCSEQLVPVEWREHGDALEITATGRTHFGAAEALFSCSMEVG